MKSIGRRGLTLALVVVVLAAVAGGVSAQIYGTYFESVIIGKQLWIDPAAEVTMPGGTLGASSMVFEGSAADAYETTLAITNPTADRTITVPNSTGTIALNPYGESIEFEGATANDFETTLAVTDPTADVTLTLPKETAAVVVSSLTTNATDAANAVTGASNGLVFEGASANGFETTITPTDPTADVTLTLPNETGTVALTSQAVDMTLEADATGGNAGAKTEYIGLPRIRLIGGGQGTNPASQTIALLDDSPDGEFAPVDADVTEALDNTYYKVGSASYKATFAATAAAGDGFIDAGLGAAAAWDDMESAGFYVYSTATTASGDLTLVLTDDGGARTFDIPAIATANTWTWVEVNIATGDLSAISDVAVLLSAAGETALGAFSLYVDVGYVWDSVDEEALGVAIQQDGVLSVVNAESGASLVEFTDYLTHYESGVDFIVYITDQSAADVVALVAY